jgi:hypothetical protein
MQKTLLIIAIAASLAATGCAVDGYVDTQPGDVYYTRPVAPGPDYMWVDGDWMWTGGRYTWHNGYWGRPRGGRTWVSGNWNHGTRGYRWNRGHWR